MRDCHWLDNGCFFRCIRKAIDNPRFYEEEIFQKEIASYCSRENDPFNKNEAVCKKKKKEKIVATINLA